MREMKIGAVSYLNTKPLVFGLESALSFDRVECEQDPESASRRDSGVDVANGKVAAGMRLVYDLPSRLADRLRTSEFDVALIPTIELLDNPQYVVVSDACIACHGPVWSVKFLSRKPLTEVRSVALDEGSRTSATLIKVMLDELGLTPSYRPLAIHADWRACDADAILIIGDRAMGIEQENLVDQEALQNNTKLQSALSVRQEFPIIYDLGEWWQQQTGLPFVFAVWVAGPRLTQAELDRAATVLGTSRDAGIQALEQLAAKYCQDYGLSTARCLDYFRSNLHFFLGREEKLGLEHFFSKAKQAGLVNYERTNRFHDCQST
ncbi:MAG TPA: menaquinone biosynthesis protein [Pirellulaceae bacterium]|nr:menaquinone biosynthesis protein [Pirellulaceae bacterium]HMO91605.1 menaquinone biosynthesis protein [Pirellulaceae bacterium]HMP68302.1 menaquinone biosynthesis protein [Pirellulaceae bacterium]